jgi:hypothetical protein
MKFNRRHVSSSTDEPFGRTERQGAFMEGNLVQLTDYTDHSSYFQLLTCETMYKQSGT